VSIGKELTITHAKENRVYTIDNKTACDTYTYYLGEDVGGKIPNINTEFPLVITKDGIALFPDNGKDAKTLLQHADLAMYKAKEKGGNTAVFFT